MVSLSETVFIFVAIPLDFIKNEYAVLVIISTLSLGIAIAIYIIVISYSRKIKYQVLKSIFIRILLLGIVFIGLLFSYYGNKARINIYTIVIMAFAVIMFIYTYMLEQSQKEIEMKNLELEMQEVYGGAYKELLTEVRTRQHDFKNQLSAIYSMHFVAKTLDELIDMQNEYGNKVVDNCKYDSILTCCDNSILAGYIYYRCITCEKEGIEVLYNIHMENVSCSFALHEVIEMLGILIDNASEHILGENAEIKCIKLDLTENETEIRIVVSNPTEYHTCEEIENMFKSGYSTKGKNRGIGLARVLELVKEHDVELVVRSYENRDVNWIEFAIIENK